MFKRFFILLVVMFMVVPALAQNTPDPINAALQDLSTRLNRTVTLAQVVEWNYQQSNYPSTALGCPQAGVAYADVQTSGFQFIITYDGTVYDYRVSNDKSIIVLCGTAVAPASVPPCPPPNDPAFLTPRLTKGVQGRVVAGGLPNIIRQQPGSSSQLLGQIPPADTFLVLDGPRCTLLDKIVWWQINYNNLIGWTGEGQDGTYWLEPADIALTPTVPVLENAVITSANASQLSAIGKTNNPFALSADGKLYATVLGKAVAIVDIASQNPVTNFGETEFTPTSLAFNATGTELAVGLANGEIRLFDLMTQRDIGRLSGHTAAVTAVTFSPDGTLLASGSVDTTLRLWDMSTNSLLATLNTDGSAAARLTFTPDGINLILHDQNGTNTTYVVKTGAVG